MKTKKTLPPNYPTTQLPNYPKGFTLIELLVASAVLATMGLMIAGIYMAQFGLFSRQSAQIDNSVNNTIAIDEIAQQIKESETVTQCLLPGSPWNNCFLSLIGTVSYIPSATQLVLRVWPIDNNKQSFDPYDPYWQTFYYGGTCDPNGDPTPPPPIPAPCVFDIFVYQIKSGTKNLIKKTITVSGGSPGRSARLPDCGQPVCLSTDKILATNVTALDFKYYTADDDNVTGIIGNVDTQNSVAYIVVSITTTTKPISGPPVLTTTTRKATIRNK